MTGFEVAFGLIALVVVLGWLVRHERKIWRLHKDASRRLSEPQKKPPPRAEYGGTKLP